MNRTLRFLTVLLIAGLLVPAILAGAQLQIPASEVAAQAPPTKQPAEPPTAEPPPTEEPPTAEPPTAEPPTEEPPTAEPPAQDPPAQDPPEEPASSQPKPGPSKDNPFCKSLLTGVVYGADGQPTTGATVMMQGNGDDRTMMTDDKGQFGFGGLCPGSVTVVATLPGGQPTEPNNLEMDGKNPYYVELGQKPAGVAAPDPVEADTSDEPPIVEAADVPETTAMDSEPSMPETGSNRLLLAGVAILGLLLLAAGVRLGFAIRPH